MSNYDENTLLIKHLPPALSASDRVAFLKHLGASEVNCVCSAVKKSSLTFARFKSNERCRAVLKSLHQKEILGSVVSVEFARKKSGGFADVDDNGDGSSEQVDGATSQRKLVEGYLKKLNSWTNDLDFNVPPPAHLRYQYPPPSTPVLRNICRVLARVPKFYTQVLHLMNKMNLPCPFSETFDVDSDLVGEDFEEPLENIKMKAKNSDSESEIESDGEQQSTVVLPQKRKTPRLKKIARFPKIVKMKPSADQKTSVKPEEVFETSRVLIPKKIELKVSADLNALTDSGELDVSTESFGLIGPKISEPPEQETTKVEQDGRPCGVISSEELEMNRIPPKDFHLLPVFKNYQPGVPTCRLYVKNLSKTVSTSDLEFVFNRYRIEETGEQTHLFDIRLMQEGRMKGQAFVSLQNVELAEKAVKETNGYILKGKAMVVQFARSNKPK